MCALLYSAFAGVGSRRGHAHGGGTQIWGSKRRGRPVREKGIVPTFHDSWGGAGVGTAGGDRERHAYCRDGQGGGGVSCLAKKQENMNEQRIVFDHSIVCMLSVF